MLALINTATVEIISSNKHYPAPMMIKSMSSSYDFIIIGAGLSGCYIYFRLKKINPNYKIVIVEKNDCIGGRLYSIKIGDNVYDLGGMRFSNTSHPLMRELVSELGLTTVPLGELWPSSKSLEEMMEGVNIKKHYDEGFVEYAINHNYNPNKLSEEEGYDMLRSDMLLRDVLNLNNTVKDWMSLEEGFQYLCEKMVEGADVRLNTTIFNVTASTVTGYDFYGECKKVIYTGQVDDLEDLLHVDYGDRFVPYSAFKIYIPTKINLPVAGYTSPYPIRKLTKIKDAILVYCDQESAQIMNSIVSDEKYKTLQRWIYMAVKIKIPMCDIEKSVFCYWDDAVYWYRGETQPITLPTNITVVNGDYSDLPGWMEGSLRMANSTISSLQD